MIDLNDMELVTHILNDIASAKNVARKRAEYISYEVGTGLLRKYVQAKIKSMYPKTWDNYTIAEFSLVKKVVDKKARAYKEQPIRKLPNDNESKLYNEILTANRFGDATKTIDAIYNQHKYAALYVEQGEEEGKVNFYPLRPYEYDVVKSDDGCVECLILSYPGAQITGGTQESVVAGDRADDDINEVEYVFWTNDQHRVLKCDVTKDGVKIKEDVELEGNPNKINPYGIIPLAFLPYDFSEDYPSPSPLAAQTIELNSLLSVYLTSANMQVGQLVLKFPEKQKIEQVSQGLMTAISLPQSSNVEDKPCDASYISPSPDLAGHREAIMTYLTMILDEQGINSASAVTKGDSQKFTSGFDRLLSEADVQSIIEDNQDMYVRFEQHVFDVVNALMGGKFKADRPQVIFKKPKMLTSDTELLDNIQRMLDLGLIEDWEKFQIVDPNLSEEQAREKLARINENKSITPSADSKMNQPRGN